MLVAIILRVCTNSESFRGAGCCGDNESARGSAGIRVGDGPPSVAPVFIDIFKFGSSRYQGMLYLNIRPIPGQSIHFICYAFQVLKHNLKKNYTAPVYVTCTGRFQSTVEPLVRQLMCRLVYHIA